MHVYLDESGNAAPLAQRSATWHFVLAVLAIGNREDVERAIQQLRHKLRFDKEFKLHRTPLELRIALLKMAVAQGLSFDVMVVDKNQLSDQWCKCNSLELYRAMAGELLAEVVESFRNVIVVVDKIDSYQTSVLRSSIRATINLGGLDQSSAKRIRKVSGHDSSRDDLLQLTDVVAGSVFRARERGDPRCLQVIAPRVR
jgi:hypothetical protein